MSVPEPFRERAFRFALAILREYRHFLADPRVPRQLAIQMLRSGTSIGANLEEARSATSRRDLIAKNAIALREARECLYWLRLISSDQPSLGSRIADLTDECRQLVAMLTVAIHRLRTTQRHSRKSAVTG